MKTSKGQSEHREYILTSKGFDFKPVIIALSEWGDKWAAPNGPPIIYLHEGCGGKIETHLSCKKCGNKPKMIAIQVRRTEAFNTYLERIQEVNQRKKKKVSSKGKR